MGCCGQKRQQWQQRMQSYPGPVQTAAEPVPEHPVRLRYKGTNTIMVKGEQSGFIYLFAAGEPGLAVDGRDVQQILSVSQEFSLIKSKKSFVPRS
jgi:hypothetical protein